MELVKLLELVKFVVLVKLVELVARLVTPQMITNHLCKEYPQLENTLPVLI